jgi:hypothetical protein
LAAQVFGTPMNEISAPTPKRRAITAMLDSNVYNKLMTHEEARSLLQQSVTRGALILYCTSVQINELKATPDLVTRARLLSLMPELNIQKLIVDYAPYGKAYGECYGGLSHSAIRMQPEQIITPSNHHADAMIAITATSKNHNIDFLVTEEKRLPKKVNDAWLKTTAMTLSDFVELLRENPHGR